MSNLNIRNANVVFSTNNKTIKTVTVRYSVKRKSVSMLTKIPNIHFDAFKTRSSIVFMTFRFGIE